jgi:integrase
MLATRTTARTPRELRHTGGSLLSLGGVPIEEIARIAGHATTRTTELIYRQELLPVITTGATALDHLLPHHDTTVAQAPPKSA